MVLGARMNHDVWRISHETCAIWLERDVHLIRRDLLTLEMDHNDLRFTNRILKLITSKCVQDTDKRKRSFSPNKIFANPIILGLQR